MSSLLARGLVCAALALGWAAAPAGAAATQLSHGEAFSDVYFNNTSPQISPGGQYAVYVQDAVVDNAFELWSVRLDGTTPPVRLSDPLNSGQAVAFAISASSSPRVVYMVDQDVPGTYELYSIPIDGSTARVQLNPNMAADRRVRSFLISPTGLRVFYTADQESFEKIELFAVSISGGASVRLNADLLFDYDVLSYQVTPDGSTVVYRQGRDATNTWELWSVSAFGPAESAVRINRSLNGGTVGERYQISADGETVVYSANATVSQRSDLYSVATVGGTSIQLNIGLAADTSVQPSFLISANAADPRVVLRSAPVSSPLYQLYSVPLSGGSVTRLNGPLGSGEAVATGFGISPDGNTVVYRSDEETNDVNELRSVPILGGTPTKLNPELVSGGDVLGSPNFPDFLISPDGTRVVYLADQNLNDVNELFSVPLDGGPVTKLNRTLVSQGDVQTFLISPNSEFVVYGADQDADAVDKLLRAPIAGGTVQLVNSPLVLGGDVVLTRLGLPAFEISPTNSFDVLYAADEVVNDETELFLSGPPDDSPGDCASSASTLCLQGRLYAVNVNWRDFQGHTGQGQATQLSNQSGDFWFFGPDSNEMIVKIIDGCDNNGRFWVSWRALSNVEMDLTIRNTDTHQILTYHNPLAFVPNGHLDIDTIFHCDGTGPATQHYDTSTDLPAPGIPQLVEYQDPALIGPCLPAGDTAICLKSGRFRVEGTWRNFTGQSGSAHMIKKNEASGYGWFFSSDNYELLFKENDGCSYNGSTWVFVAGLTNVEATFTITDKWTGAVYRQENGLGVDFPTNLDIETNLTYCGPHPFTPAAPAISGVETLSAPDEVQASRAVLFDDRTVPTEPER